MIRTLGTIRQFDQCVLNMGLIHLCNQASYVGQEIRRQQTPWADEDEPTGDPWRRLHQITLRIPHPDQQYEGIILEAGLSQGYNLEVKAVADPSQIPYNLPEGGQFVVVMKQTGLDAGFALFATGIFIRPLALLRLDLITDITTADCETIVVKHPILRDYPTDWQAQLQQFLSHTRAYDALSNLVGYVDQTVNTDYRPPSWDAVHLAAKGFAGV